eukprot:52603-Eustigmatos_ZCMA.PRE.1
MQKSQRLGIAGRCVQATARRPYVAHKAKWYRLRKYGPTCMAWSCPATKVDDEEMVLCESLSIGSAEAEAHPAARTSCVTHKSESPRPGKSGPAYV